MSPTSFFCDQSIIGNGDGENSFKISFILFLFTLIIVILFGFLCRLIKFDQLKRKQDLQYKEWLNPATRVGVS